VLDVDPEPYRLLFLDAMLGDEGSALADPRGDV